MSCSGNLTGVFSSIHQQISRSIRITARMLLLRRAAAHFKERVHARLEACGELRCERTVLLVVFDRPPFIRGTEAGPGDRYFRFSCNTVFRIGFRSSSCE